MNVNNPTTSSCCVCCKEIPLDAAFTPEGVEYVEHFCGLECYQRFQARAKAGTKPVLIRTPAARCRQTEAYPNLMSGRAAPLRQNRVCFPIF
ncbi:DUF3330 domain-containing protein [Klebsiella pneumoniae]|uniref:DUF3330 domain-containing protein n=1 Tax=Klebsiella pneumoniae TaxID=573 RepID=UPI003CCD186B